MPSSTERRFRARCADCPYRSPSWTTSFIAHVEAAGHRDRTDHETTVVEGGRRADGGDRRMDQTGG
jgi:hypothetical protein